MLLPLLLNSLLDGGAGPVITAATGRSWDRSAFWTLVVDQRFASGRYWDRAMYYALIGDRKP
jgi:hypothetical protein